MNVNAMHQLDAARSAAEDGTLDSWVQQYLRGPGERSDLADELSGPDITWVGPEPFALSQLARQVGPEHGMPEHEESLPFELQVQYTQLQIVLGWMPPPLIVDAADMRVLDSPYTHEALLRAGYTHHWAVFAKVAD